jgi:hypothetical protein
LQAANHLPDAVVLADEIVGFRLINVLPSVCGIEAGAHFTIRPRRHAQKLHKLPVVVSQKSLTDVVHDRNARSIHLVGEGKITSEFRPRYEFSNAIALPLCRLPDAKVLETINAHVV